MSSAHHSNLSLEEKKRLPEPSGLIAKIFFFSHRNPVLRKTLGPAAESGSRKELLDEFFMGFDVLLTTAMY